MKKHLVFIIAGLFLLFASCASNSDIDNLQSQINELKSGQIATIENQIFNINGSITTLQEADREIKGYITALQNTATELQKSINSANGKIDDLQKALTLINTAIETLQAKDSALEKRIDDLKDYVDTQLKNSRDWVSATFATLEQYHGIVSEIGGLRGSISSINSAMEQMEGRLDGMITSMKGEIEATYSKAMGTLETSLKNWVNEQLQGYLTIAETEAKLAALKRSLEKEDESIRGDIDKLSTSLDSTKTELAEGYKAAIKKAIDENNGVIDGKIAEAVSVLNTRIDGEVSTINKRIDTIEKRVSNLETQVSALVSRIQSLTYIPRYTDGSSTMWLKMKPDGSYEAKDTLEFRVSPADCADSLVKVWDKAITAEAVSLATRAAQETVSLPVVSVTGGKGKFSVVLDGSSLGDSFFTGEKQMKAVVIISDGNNERTSEYVPMGTSGDVILKNNIIYYTSYNGATINPCKLDVFGANIISNEYKAGRGIILFDGNVTGIGAEAFRQCNGLTSIIIPNSAKYIDESAFSACTSLTSILIPSSVTSIGTAAFTRCTGLTSIEIPDSVTSIGSYAFNGCTGLTSIEIPDSIKIIQDGTFSGCAGLTSIEIPESVNSIGNSAFYGCTGLTSIEIPDSVKSIGNYAFYGCTGLTSIEIPDSVKSIGNYAFYGCSALTFIICLSNKPYTVYNVTFENTNNCPIYVPSESVDLYKVNSSWKHYSDRIQANSDRFSSNVTWTLGSSTYTQEATVNGISGVQVLKLGTSSKAGNATVLIPKGTKSVSFYGVSWKGRPATVVIKMGDSESYSQDLSVNDGAFSNPPYTMTVAGSDNYTMILPSQLTEDATFTITTAEGGNTRIFLFGIRSK
jgi:uncharacterized coiled-coil DUF342 family protein